MYILTDQQAKSLSRISVWWKDELIKQGKIPEDDIRLQWMICILSKKKYTDNAKEFLNQMRDMYLGKPKPQKVKSQYNYGGGSHFRT